MKVLVTYISWTGNTKKVAEAIYDGIAAEKEIKELGQVANIDGYDLAFVGFPMHGVGQPAEEARDFLRKHCNGRNVALFITHAAIEDFSLMPEWLANCLSAAEGTNLFGMFHCQGQIAEEQIDLLLKSPDPQAQDIARRVVESRGKPDKERLDKARAFAGEMTEKMK